MRLRKLGHGQSLMFVSPPEVHQSILEFMGHVPNTELSGLDVIAWSLEQSCSNIERCQPLRIMQGLGHRSRQKVAEAFSQKFPCCNEITEDDIGADEVKAFREKEDQTLNDLYAPAALRTTTLPDIIQSSQADTSPMVQSLLGIWRELDDSMPQGATMHEEHEREIAHEIEQETQIERPPRAKALCSRVDKRLRKYIHSGENQEFRNFALAFNGVAETSSAAPLVNNAKSVWSQIRVTKGFIETVERPISGFCDNYLRPVN